MLSDEERKAIERVEQFIDGERQYNTKTGETIIPYEYGESQRFVYKETYYAIQVVLNLIEKQSKEIEERIRNKFVSKDKIKAKIEPVLKQLERKMQEEYNKNGISREYQNIVDAYNFLQSLLEKE